MSTTAIKEKIANATKISKTIINQTQQINVPVFSQWMMQTKKHNFDKELINLSETLSEKLQYLLHGKPYIIEHKEETEIGQFSEDLMLQEVMFHLEKLLFEYGSGYVILEKIGSKNNPKIQLRIAEPNFPNVVSRLGNTKIRAEVWATFKYDKVNYYQMTTYTNTKITNEVYTNAEDAAAGSFDMSAMKKMDLKAFNDLLPEAFKVKGSMPNAYKFIPVVEVQWKPTMDFSWKGRADIAPANRVKSQQAFLNEGTKALSLELYLNRTKILVDADMLNSADKEALHKLADENILGLLSDTGNYDGGDKKLEVIQGDPKVDQYWANITNIISLATSALKLSELGEGDAASSATGEIFNKGNDVETGNTLQIFRQKAIAEIMTKALAMKEKESFEEYEIDTSDFSIQLIPNIIMNEAKMTDIITKQLSAGLLSMTQAKVKLEGISSEDAKNSLLEVGTDEHYNPSLEAVSSFTDNGENADKQTGNPQPENTK